MLNLAATLTLGLQQGVVAATGLTSPLNGDTTGYWQQRVHYTIVATLDERAQKVRAQGTMRYVNNSPDTLREMFVHQYLNAFRPHSRWSEVDEREGRGRFQHLEEPNFGYERFTAPVRVNDAPVVVDYPGAPDSTVAHFALPRPLAPGDSATVAFEWDARPSTLPRRQGRRGRHWDLAQWYPKVAVYDRGGWQHNALQPAGEFYGEFGTYDVSLILANDQVVAATGVPVSGDPGWRRVIRAGQVRTASNAYGDVGETTARADAGQRVVRFHARDVHHFAWTASPDYRYEGASLVRRAPDARFRAWDTLALHVLYRAGDDTVWGGGRVLQRTANAIQWLEAVYGAYAYPQMTVVHRLDGGGTEFPMMQMNGSASQGLILHEGGHIWTYGILANNEWRSGWMDEGFTSYQTAWAQALTPQERQRQNITAGARDDAVGYRRRAIRMLPPRFEILNVEMASADLRGAAEPIGTRAQDFRDFYTYNDMIYDRAEIMYGQLRDVLGDSLFLAFTHDYYTRWALRHVDERAMRVSAERVSKRDLGWFFDQWVHRTGVMDYRLGRTRSTRDSTGGWITEVTVQRVGSYAHPMNVGVRTAAGWTISQMTQQPYDNEVVWIRTSLQPLEVRLDPYHVTWDWDRRNDVPRVPIKPGIDWPFLRQADRNRQLWLLRPMAWYSDAGGAAIGLRVRESYLAITDKSEGGFAFYTRADDQEAALNGWLRFENPLYLTRSPAAMNWRFGAGYMDGVGRIELAKKFEWSGGVRRRNVDVAVNVTKASTGPTVPEGWMRDTLAADLTVRGRWHVGSVNDSYWFVAPKAMGGASAGGGYGKAEIALGRVKNIGERGRFSFRAYAGGALNRKKAPAQRLLYLSAEDPVTTYGNHWWRPLGGILKRPNVNWLPLGGAALRGVHWGYSSEYASGLNAEMGRKLLDIGTRADTMGVWLTAFADAATTEIEDLLADAGPGLAFRGNVYDLPVNLRIDFPVFVSEPLYAIGKERSTNSFAFRWTLTFNDIW